MDKASCQNNPLRFFTIIMSPNFIPVTSDSHRHTSHPILISSHLVSVLYPRHTYVYIDWNRRFPLVFFEINDWTNIYKRQYLELHDQDFARYRLWESRDVKSSDLPGWVYLGVIIIFRIFHNTGRQFGICRSTSTGTWILWPRVWFLCPSNFT